MYSMPKATIVLATILISANVTMSPALAQACYSGWSFENVTTGSGGPGIVGTPSTFSWNQNNVGKRDEVYARNGAGDLIHYFRIGSGAWVGENLSAITGSTPFLRTDPVAVPGHQRIQNMSFSRHDVYAVDTNDELIHYWWSEIPPSGWHFENLTASRGGPKVWSKPVVDNSRYFYNGEWRLKTDVYSIDVYGDLIHYWWTRAQGWNHENLTQTLGGARFLRDNGLSIVNEDPSSPSIDPVYHHLFGSSASGHLLHYFWSRNAGWDWENLTLVNGIQTHPIIASGSGATAANGTMNGVNRPRYSVFGFLGTNLIRYWSWNLANPWNSEDVTTSFGFNGSSGSIIGRPTVGRSRQVQPSQGTPTINDVYVRHDLYARDANRHLIHYWSWDSWPSFKLSNGVIPWQRGENLTTKIDGIFIETDPIVVIKYVGGDLANPEHYVFGRINDRLVNYCWTKRNGWSSRTMQTISTPRGDNVSGDPALTPNSNVGMSVYAAAADGDLLHFWKP